MPNKEMPQRSSGQPGKLKPGKVRGATEADSGLAGREDLSKDSGETDFEITGRESLVNKKDLKKGSSSRR